MNSITVFIFFSFYKLITIYILLRIVTLCRLRNFISLFINKLSDFVDSRSWCISFLLVDMFCITLIISCGSYKFISFDVFFIFCSIFFWSNSITIFIDVFCNYFCWSRFLSININYISLIISFCSYYFISFDIFAWIFSFLSLSNFISIFINILSYNIWCNNFLLVNMNCITIIIFICTYIIVAINIYLILCSFFWWK